MYRSRMISAALAALVLGSASLAHADNRSSAAVSAQAKPNTSNNGKNVENPTFPDNRGIERAREVANEHSRLRRSDSEG